ncbi:MBL fold metallo-hydrolase [Kribbella sp. WER1]
MLQHLTGRVWLAPLDPDPDAIRPSVAVIADDRGSVLVDAGNGPEHARTIRTAIAAAGLSAPKWLVYTHHHWDHTWGACAWPDVTVVAHTSTAGLLQPDEPWSHRYLHDQVARNPKLGPSYRARALAVPDWSGFRVVVPDQTFDDTLTLPTGVVPPPHGRRHRRPRDDQGVPGRAPQLVRRRALAAAPAVRGVDAVRVADLGTDLAGPPRRLGAR